MNPQDKPVILIADDSRVVRVSLKNILNNDCLLIEAEDGVQAWEELLEAPDIRLIFSDLSMPRLDGRELLHKVRNSEISRIRNIPFIMVTGHEEDSSTRDELQDMGATEVVSKPFDPASIVSFVSTLVSRQDNESYMLLPEEEAQTEHLTDALTQDDFMQCASKELSFAIRNKNELAIALLRIDQFEQLESHYSEPAIGHILLTLSEIVRQHIHPDDSLAYFGNGLFAILRPASNAIGTRYISRRIIEDLAAKQFYLGESGDLVSVSVGISAPQIKPGIRLRELLLLAEGRLKSAMGLGGNRVIDKGNDTLTPVNLSSDSAPETLLTSHLHSDSIKSSHLRLDSSSIRPRNGDAIDPQKLQGNIEQLQSRIESLVHENKELHGQIERWQKQSGESEQLRRRVFEVESEQQQLQLKLSELSSHNSALQKRVDEAECEQKKLLDNEDEKSLTLKQANQFYEQENIRLEGQLEAISNRAQKAELAQRKSEQLIISLKDNIKLLRAQMEQIQKQLLESQQQASQPAPPPTEPDEPSLDIDININPVDSEETYIETRSDSDLVFDGFPSGTQSKAENEPAPVAHLFADSAPAAPVRVEIPAEKPAVASKPAAVETPSPVIPNFLPKAREGKYRQPTSLSSFTIASLIMLLFLALGGGYLYFYWQDDMIVAKVQEATAGASTSTAIPTNEPNRLNPSKPAPTSQSQAIPENKPVASATARSVPSAPDSSTIADEEARLQAELALRQIAEEEFKLRLQQAPQEDTDTQPTAEEGIIGDREEVLMQNLPAAAMTSPEAEDQTMSPENTAADNPETPTSVAPADQPAQ